MVSRVRRPTGVLLALLQATQVAGCTSWHAVTVPELKAEQVNHRAHVRIATSGGNSVRLDSAWVERDSISGRLAKGSRVPADTTSPYTIIAQQPGDWQQPRVSLPVSAVREIELRQASPGKTVLLVVVPVVLVSAIGVYVFLSNLD